MSRTRLASSTRLCLRQPPHSSTSVQRGEGWVEAGKPSSQETVHVGIELWL